MKSHWLIYTGALPALIGVLGLLAIFLSPRDSVKHVKHELGMPPCSMVEIPIERASDYIVWLGHDPVDFTMYDTEPTVLGCKAQWLAFIQEKDPT